MTSPWTRRMLDDLAAQEREDAEETRTEPDPDRGLYTEAEEASEYAGPVETAEERRADAGAAYLEALGAILCDCGSPAHN